MIVPSLDVTLHCIISLQSLLNRRVTHLQVPPSERWQKMRRHVLYKYQNETLSSLGALSEAMNRRKVQRMVWCTVEGLKLFESFFSESLLSACLWKIHTGYAIKNPTSIFYCLFFFFDALSTIFCQIFVSLLTSGGTTKHT